MLSFRRLSKRVDVQSSIFTASMVLLCTLIVAWISYTITYQEIIYTLSSRVYDLFDVVEDTIDSETFEIINSPDDMGSELYITAKEELEYMKNIAGVLYLYTAKENEYGNFVYVIDGLDESEDFRPPGYLIEEEIEPEMRKALNGEYVLPNSIKETDWGDIFITYLPFHDEDGKIVGVVGIEFEASHANDTYALLRVVTVITCIFACVLTVFISFTIFRRISNPRFKDLSTTDSLTNLRNRNAFELYISNLNSRRSLKDIGVVSVDLNSLKVVNDNFGHEVGDKYIKLIADVISEFADSDMGLYRIGGDEFVVISESSNEKQLNDFVTNCANLINNQKTIPNIKASASYGYAIFDENNDGNIIDTYKRADAIMYKNKKEYKEKFETKGDLS